MSRSTGSSTRSPRLCDCGYLVTLAQSWTEKNPGRKFYACPIYDPVTKTRGCGVFEWHDQASTVWQRNIILKLKDEKERAEKENKELKKDLAEANRKLMEMNSDFVQLKMKKGGGFGVVVRGGLSSLIGLLVVVILVKVIMM